MRTGSLTASGAEVSPDTDDSVQARVDDGAPVEAVGFELVLGLTLRATSRTVLVRAGGGEFSEVVLHGAREWV